jgi:GH25 family lysozyme M1 (1,4-beta-N-acetylmuramidase)
MTAAYFPPVMFYTMVDLSHWDPLADVDPVAAFATAGKYGITKIALKATQGTDYLDPNFNARRAAAAALGIGVCAYAFLDAAPAAAQAAWFLQQLGPLDGIELAIDCESNTGADGTVTIPIAADVSQAIADTVGFPPIYYGTRYGPDGNGGGLPNAVLARTPLWLAAWSAMPVCPDGWDEWLLWQSTDGMLGRDALPVPGLGVVDRSYIAASSLDAIDTWWGKR